MTPPRILLTGFEPFDGESVNPSWQVARSLQGETIAGARVHSPSLPLATLVQGVRLALRAAVTTATDLRASAGAES